MVTAGAGRDGSPSHDPDSIVRRIVEDARKRLGLTTQALAERLEIDRRSFTNWMRQPRKLDATRLEKLVSALSLGPEDRHTLFVLTGQLPPAPPAEELRATREMAVYQMMIDGLAHPTQVYGYDWDNVIMNKAYTDIFGKVRPHATAHPMRNPMRYTLFHPDAPQILAGGDIGLFREHWFLPALAHFSLTLQQRPNDQRLLALEQQILQSHRRDYQAVPRWIVENGDDIAINAHARSFWDPRTGRETHVHVVTESHQGYQATTLIRSTLVFCDPNAPIGACQIDRSHDTGAGH